jgi:hypothetical protein
VKKVGLIALALVLALGTLGVGVAQWTETLDISGNAQTGELDVGFKLFLGCESSPYVTLNPHMCYWWDCSVKSHIFTLNNVYPSFGSGNCSSDNFFFVIYAAKNCGTIPAKVDQLNIIKPDWLEVTTYSEGVPQEVKDEAIARIQSCAEIPEEDKAAAIAKIEEDWAIGDIIGTGPNWYDRWGCIILKLHVLGDAPENSSGTVTVETVFVPFNK